MKAYINAYNNASEGAKELSFHLGALRIKPENSKFKGGQNKIVINWGSRKASEEVMNSRVLNPPARVAICSDKLAFFRHIQEWNDAQDEHYVKIPSWTTSRDDALAWVDHGSTVVCRTILNGHSGEGIILYSQEDEKDAKPLPKAPLYTMYVQKKSEFRVHIMNGEVIDVQRKARNKDVPDDEVNWKIRNHGNGFIYARNDGLGNVPARVLEEALLCMEAVGLDFGAVDIIYNERGNSAYVLEVNTAPGLQGHTATIYALAFNKHYGIDISEAVRKVKDMAA